MAGEIRIDIPRLYRAGKVDIPDEAEHLSGIGGDLVDVLSTFNTMVAQAGDPAALVNALRVGDQVYDEIRDTVGDLNDMAVATIATADHFVATDDGAAQQYNGMGNHLKDMATPQADQPRDNGDLGKPGATDNEGGHVDTTPDGIDPDDYGGFR